MRAGCVCLTGWAMLVLLGCGTTGPATRPAGDGRARVPVRIHLALGLPEPGFERIEDPEESGLSVFVQPEPILTAADIADAKAVSVLMASAGRHEVPEDVRRTLKPRSGARRSHDVLLASVAKPGVAIKLTGQAVRRVERATEGRPWEVQSLEPGGTVKRYRLAVFVRDACVAVLPIKGGMEREMLIVGSFTEEEAEDLAAQLGGRTLPGRSEP